MSDSKDKIIEATEDSCEQGNCFESEDCCKVEDSSGGAESTSIEQQLRQAQEQVLRVMADFDNFRKRSIKERSELLKYQGERIFQDLLEVVDNFELALNHQESEPEQIRKGMELIQKNLFQLLDKWEVKGVSALGQPFDPNSHNALSTAPAEGEVQAGQVVAELRKAYYYKDKLLRPGDVIVAVEPK
jgi:molecular chaperone GrpE